MAREDGRGSAELRSVRIKRDYIRYAEGSCLIEAGRTMIVCTASVEQRVPVFLRGTGRGWVTAEYAMLPRSCASRSARESHTGRPSGRSQEIQRLIGRALRTVVDLKALGERTIWLDCDVLQADGGTRTASVTGSFIALYDALRWMKEKKMVGELPVKSFVAGTSAGLVNGEPLLDLTYEEDSRAEVDMNVVMTAEGGFIELQGTAEKEPFSAGQLNDLLGLAAGGVQTLIAAQREALR